MNERINITNYEAWMLDYVEGNLSDEQLAEFYAFLDKHPELVSEMEEFDPNFTLPQENISYGDTLDLKQNGPLPKVNLENYDDYFVGHVEGDLNADQEVSMKNFIEAHPEKQRDLDLYKKTVLPLETIPYPNKSELKRKDTKVIPIGRWVSVASAAAAIALLFIWAPWEGERSTGGNQQFAIETGEPENVNQQGADDNLKTQENNIQVAENNEEEPDFKTVPQNVTAPTVGRKERPVVRETMEPISSPAVALVPEKRSAITNVGTLYDPSMVTPINDLPDPEQDLAVTDPGTDDDYVTGRDFLRQKLLQGVEKVTGQETSFEKKKESEYVATNFSIGGFEFSRSKKK